MERDGFGGKWKKYSFTCNVCKKEYLMRRVAGLTGMCTKCRTDKWMEENELSLKEKHRAYRIKNKERVSAVIKRWNDEHKEQKRVRAKLLYENRTEEQKQRAKEWSARYRETHRKECNERISNWKKKNKPLLRVYRQRRRVRTGKRDFSTKLYNELLERQNYKCVYCFVDITEINSFDHIIPIVQGGDNSPENLQLLCPFCNTSKGGKNHDQFLEYRCSKS